MRGQVVVVLEVAVAAVRPSPHFHQIHLWK
jgi:hypothetical protein